MDKMKGPQGGVKPLSPERKQFMAKLDGLTKMNHMQHLKRGPNQPPVKPPPSKLTGKVIAQPKDKGPGSGEVGDPPTLKTNPKHTSQVEKNVKIAKSEVNQKTVEPTKTAIPKTITVNLPGHGDMKVATSMIPAEVRAHYEKEGKTDEMLKEFSAKIERGAVWCNQVAKGVVPDGMMPTNSKELKAMPLEVQKQKAEIISDMTFFLQAAGDSKAEPFMEGAFSIPDPKGNMLKFLSTYPCSYNRLSSHMKDMQKAEKPVDRFNPGTGPRGLDMFGDNTNFKTALPGDRGTILFQKMPGSYLEPGKKDAPDRLFLKLEPHGTPSAPDDPALKGPPGKSTGLKKKWEALVGHGKGYKDSQKAQSTGGNSPPGTFKERIPPEMSKDFKAMTNLFKKTKDPEMKKLLGVLNAGKPLSSSGGMRVMARNLEKAKANFPDAFKNNRELREAADKFEKDWSRNAAYDNVNLRIGQEIILNPEEFGIVQ